MIKIENYNGVPTSVVRCDGCGEFIYDYEVDEASVETIRDPDGKTRDEHRHELCASGGTRIMVPRPSTARPATGEEVSARGRREANFEPVRQIGSLLQADVVMEEATSLRTRLDEGPRLTLAEALVHMHGLLYALDRIHDGGIIHRNLHPGSVLVDGAGGVTLRSFVLVDGPVLPRAGDRDEMSPALMTMSPEQIQGTSCDARSDLFQAGAIFYQMLTGVPPFTGPGSWSIAEKILREDPAPPSSVNPAIPASLDAVLRRALAKDPSQRYQRAAEFGMALARAVPELHDVLRAPSVNPLKRFAIGLARALVRVSRFGRRNMKPIATVQEAQRAIESYQGKPEDFRLPIAEELLDPAGINMAIITDSVLAREWEPDGYFQENGFRTYKFKRLGS